jgi:hypothetical protein
MKTSKPRAPVGSLSIPRELPYRQHWMHSGWITAEPIKSKPLATLFSQLLCTSQRPLTSTQTKPANVGSWRVLPDADAMAAHRLVSTDDV